MLDFVFLYILVYYDVWRVVTCTNRMADKRTFITKCTYIQKHSSDANDKILLIAALAAWQSDSRFRWFSSFHSCFSQWPLSKSFPYQYFVYIRCLLTLATFLAHPSSPKFSVVTIIDNIDELRSSSPCNIRTSSFQPSRAQIFC
jgi:hypothetical protein